MAYRSRGMVNSTERKFKRLGSMSRESNFEFGTDFSVQNYKTERPKNRPTALDIPPIVD